MTHANFPDSPGTSGLAGDAGTTPASTTGTTTGSVGGTGSLGSSGGSSSGGATGEAKDQAKQTAGTAKEETKHVASVAQGEAQNVASEAKSQASMLLGEARSQVDEQSRMQRDKLVETLRTLGDDLEQMAAQGNSGLAADMARQVADRARTISSRMDGREPTELLDEVRDFARRRPGTFLLGSLVAGMVAGRLARGAKEAKSSSGGSGTSRYGVAGTGYGYAGTTTGIQGTDPLATPPADTLGTVPAQPSTVETDPLTGTLPSPGRSVAADQTWTDTQSGRDLR